MVSGSSLNNYSKQFPIKDLFQLCEYVGVCKCTCLQKIIIYLQHSFGGSRLNIHGGIRSPQQTGQVIISAQQNEPDPVFMNSSAFYLLV